VAVNSDHLTLRSFNSGAIIADERLLYYIAEAQVTWAATAISEKGWPIYAGNLMSPAKDI
jgi:hypothetical protein